MRRIVRAAVPLAVLGFALLSLPGAAEQAPAPPPYENPQMNTADFAARGKQQIASLTIAKLNIDVAITGDIARTTVTATFENPGVREVEGEFLFDLPPGSAVTGYALDVDGRLRDGVLMAPRKARLAFEARERRGIDPGLAEITRDNAFRTQVYPVMPKKGRTISLRFVTPLDRERPFRLPLAVLRPVGQVSVKIRSVGAAAPPKLTAPQGLALAWSRDGGGFAAAAEASHTTLAGNLEVASTPQADTLRIGTERNGERFFEIAGSTIVRHAARKPEVVRVYWDVSRSHRDADLARETALLQAWLQSTQPQSADLVLFSDGPPVLRHFAGADGRTQLLAAVAAAAYRGATSLGTILNDLPVADACLLFSDGNNTLGAWKMPRPGAGKRCPVFTVSSARDAAAPVLGVLAANTGGEFLDLTALSNDAALARLAASTPRVTYASASDGSDLAYVLLANGRDGYRLAGRAPKSGAIALRFSDGGERRHRLDDAKPGDGTAIAALWAQQRAAVLNAEERPGAERVLALLRRYSVASQAASFIVFETGEDYAEAGAEPPAGLGEDELKNYREAMARKAKGQARARERRLAAVMRSWDEQKAWWRRRFDPNAKPLPPKQARENGGAASAPAPAPPSFASGLMGNLPSNDIQTVVVTAQKAGDPLIALDMEPWDSKRPYVTALKAAKAGEFPAVYRAQEAQYGNLPVFYLDAAEFLFQNGRRAEAVATVTNALDLPTTTDATRTIVAERLMRYGDGARALWLYEQLMYLEPDLPQPLRDLALALVARAGHETGAARIADYRKALTLFNRIVTETWADAYDGIELIALMEANRVIPKLRALGVNEIPLDPRLVARLDVDIRVVLEWNTDITDMDLWVDEPNGERAIYSNPRTVLGGRLSNDMTAGYGPEEYLLHRAPRGTYTIRANIYGTDQLNPNGPITIRAHLFRNYGRDSEDTKVLEVELQPDEDGEKLIGRITVGR